MDKGNIEYKVDIVDVIDILYKVDTVKKQIKWIYVYNQYNGYTG